MNSRTYHLWCLVMLLVAALFIGARLQAQDTVKIQIDPKTVTSHISPDFIGFGFETSAVAESNFFSGSNRVMIQLYRNLTTHGLMRIGGIISDHAKYAPEGTPAARTMKDVTVINKTNLGDLADFAQAAGWKVMWGLNLGTGTKEEAVQEALAVDVAMGNTLQSFQIGNEVEDLRRFKKSYDAYHAAYVDYKAAIRAVLPNAPFSGPDSVGNLLWITNFAAAEGRDIKLLTHHYYRGGAGDPRTSVDRLLQTDTNWDARLKKLQEICRDNGLAFRINEVNSFSGGGKPGVSDTFGSALWCLDFMFRVASYGCEGVNMETDVNQLGFISYYSPIVHTPDGQCSARPEYYGMLAFAMAGKGELLKLSMNNTDINLSAYATRESDEAIWITVVNKDFARDANIEIALPHAYPSIAAFRLTAPSVESKDHATLGGSEVSADGTWTPHPPETLKADDGTAYLTVPHASAVLILLHSRN